MITSLDGAIPGPARAKFVAMLVYLPEDVQVVNKPIMTLELSNRERIGVRPFYASVPEDLENAAERLKNAAAFNDAGKGHPFAQIPIESKP